ncbi:MAG TPA: hypothetical protein VFA46_20940 [Actinomycetes bacterium]|jgi:hypothetical protein|nr:hypothetical protein [Actinomycetes bacterium]
MLETGGEPVQVSGDATQQRQRAAQVATKGRLQRVGRDPLGEQVTGDLLCLVEEVEVRVAQPQRALQVIIARKTPASSESKASPKSSSSRNRSSRSSADTPMPGPSRVASNRASARSSSSWSASSRVV